MKINNNKYNIIHFNWYMIDILFLIYIFKSCVYYIMSTVKNLNKKFKKNKAKGKSRCQLKKICKQLDRLDLNFITIFNTALSDAFRVDNNQFFYTQQFDPPLFDFDIVIGLNYNSNPTDYGFYSSISGINKDDTEKIINIDEFTGGSTTKCLI